MASIVVTGDTSGAITIAAPAVAGTNTLTLPASTGTLVVTGGAQTIEFADGSAAAPSITNSGDTNTGIFFPAADTIAFTEGGTESMRITSTGTVAIGTTTTPTAKLWVESGRVGLTNTFKLGWHSNPAHGDLNNYITGDDATNYVAIGTSATERMRITSTGLVGIGLNDPATFSSGVAQTVIERTSAGNNTVALALVNRSGTTNTSVSLDFNPNTNIALAQIRAFRTDASFGGGTDLRFLNYDGSALAERMRITSVGNVLVGATSTTPNPGVVMQTDGNISCGNSAGGSGFEFLSLRRSAVQIGGITQNGTTAVQFNTTSDYRLKENIVPMTGALEKVAQLKPVTYKWKSDGSDGQGFIAHELQAVVPDCVSGEKNAVETYTDEEGNEQTRPKYQGIDTSFLVATLTAAIQELNAKVEAQAVRIAELEGAK